MSVVSNPNQILRIGTRGSPLALRQAEDVRDRLIEAHGLHQDQVVLEIITTTGDKIQDKSLRAFGGKGLFTKEIEQALLDEKIDMAVHSMKDMPTRLPDGLDIPCILEREDMRDAFISPKAARLQDLPQGAVVGSSSLRRQAMIKKLRPDIKVVTYRGNVQTRLRKLDEGVVDATILACAGLNRLGMRDVITAPLEIDEMLPAVAQGAVGVEIKSDKAEIKALLSPLNHAETAQNIEIERAFLAELDGSCHTPIAGIAVKTEGIIGFKGMILSLDGAQSYEGCFRSAPDEAIEKAKELAHSLLLEAGEDFFAALHADEQDDE